MKQVGLSMKRVDAYDKATGRTLYGGDRIPQKPWLPRLFTRPLPWYGKAH